jgi:hypothetical protein
LKNGDVYSNEDIVAEGGKKSYAENICKEDEKELKATIPQIDKCILEEK